MAERPPRASITIRTQEEGIFSRFGENVRSNALGGMVFLIWRTVTEAPEQWSGWP